MQGKLAATFPKLKYVKHVKTCSSLTHLAVLKGMLAEFVALEASQHVLKDVLSTERILEGNGGCMPHTRYISVIGMGTRLRSFKCLLSLSTFRYFIHYDV